MMTPAQLKQYVRDTMKALRTVAQEYLTFDAAEGEVSNITGQFIFSFVGIHAPEGD